MRLSRDGTLEARPIKGTAARDLHDAARDERIARALAASDKDRSENLMIVDLLRNDLGRVCDAGSVHVPGMMEVRACSHNAGAAYTYTTARARLQQGDAMQVETFATVHQLVSTVRGRKRRQCSAAAAFFSAFPGGSMTGAPKVRSMEVIDGLEGRARGAYSGCIGYFSVNGTFDFNIVIRTAVFHGGEVSVGAGGAIVVQSDDVGEYDEMKLKAARLMDAFAEFTAADEMVLRDGP